MRRVLLPCLIPVLCACTAMAPPQDRAVQGRIDAEMKAAAVPPKPRPEAAPLPAAVTSSLLPPLQSGAPRGSSRQLEHRFNLVVSEAPISQVLMAIVSDTRYSILVSPRNAAPVPPGPAGTQPAAGSTRLTETVTVNLKDVTVFEALDAIREMYGYEYAVDGTRIYVQPPELRTKLYHVNYVLGQRRGVSDIQVIGGASASNTAGQTGGTTATTGTGSGATGSFASIQASSLSTLTKSDIWSEMEDAVRTVLGCQIARSQPKAATTGGSTATTGGSSNSASSSNSSRADVSFVGDREVGIRMHGAEGCPEGRAITINQMSGTALVRGLPRDLRTVEALLRSMQISIERQVIIEAKIIDVELNSGSQQGINWAGFSRGLHRGSVGADPNLLTVSPNTPGGPIQPGTSLGALLGNQLLGVATPNAFSAGVGVALQFSNFTALINFLETQGTVQVLSSPRIATMNNQKAVLKVGSEEPFVTNITGGSSITTNGQTTLTPPTLSYQPFFSGIALDVTPQIDENDNITLHVHSMVNSIIEREKLALPAANSARVPFAVNSISETDSVVKTRDSQVVVIGGLMTESISDSRSRIPGAGDAPLLGSLFGKSSRQGVKRELVILLKPTVVKSDDAWVNDISATQSRIERLNAPALQR
ncbi:MAG TPA: secretin N-terminal domain-containing protein [Ramlibacter sp.]|nr:secretin N-terminal domain-containing protein [Ramlibacter sp.]